MNFNNEELIKRNLELINIQWRDIHHSRNQEWSVVSTLVAFFLLIGYTKDSYEVKLIICLSGIITSLIGAGISRIHGKIFGHKMKYISELEKEIDFKFRTQKHTISVQQFLFLLYGTICSVFVGLTIVYNKKLNYLIGFLKEPKILERHNFPNELYPLVGLVVLIVFITIIIIEKFYKRFKNQNKEKNKLIFDNPFYAQMDNIEDCLNELDDKPLKLIAREVFPITINNIKEEEWKLEEWTLNDKIKPILLNRRDIYEFSIANEKSKQEWHSHERKLEIFISEHRMILEYSKTNDANDSTTIEIEKGIIIVPPGFSHKIKLAGITFVFQVVLKGEDTDDKKS